MNEREELAIRACESETERRMRAEKGWRSLIAASQYDEAARFVALYAEETRRNEKAAPSPTRKGKS